METKNVMKSILTVLTFFILVVSGFSQTRNVVVGTNGAVVQPTNFWSADVTNARNGLGLGSAATNPSSVFQPSSSVLSNVSLADAVNLTNLRATNIVGVVSITNGGTGATNTTNARIALGLGSASTNPSSAFQPSSTVLSNLSVSNAVGLTNISANSIVGTVAIASNITGTAPLATNITGIVALANGGTGGSNESTARTSLGATTVGGNIFTLSNPDEVRFLRINANNTVSSLNVNDFRNALSVGTNAGTVTSIGMTVPSIFTLSTSTITSSGTFALGLNFQSSRQVFIAPNGGGTPAFRAIDSDDLPSVAISKITGLQTALDGKLSVSGTAPLATNVTGTVALVNGGTGSTNAANARINLELGFSALTNTNAVNFRSSIGLASYTTNPIVPIVNGGTGATNYSVAKANLGLGPADYVDFGYVDVAEDVYAKNVYANEFLTANVLTVFSNISFQNNAAALTRTNLGLGWSALTNTNASTSLLGFTTNGQVVANTGTNTLRFTNNVNFQGGPLIDGSGIFYISATNGGLNLEEGRITDINNNDVLNWSSSVELAIERPLTFGTNASTTRTNLGLGATNAVRFGSILLYQDGESTNSITYGVDSLEFRQNGVTFFSLDATSGGEVVFNKPISFTGTNSITNAATTRTNLNLGASWLTNTNAANFRTNIGLGWSALTNTNTGTSLVSVSTNGAVVSPTNFWQVAPIQTLVQDLTVVVTTQTNNATNARNLYVYSLATNVSGISNTILLPTNSATFAGDEATVIHYGTTNTLTVIRQAGATSNLIVISNYDESIKFIRESGKWDFYHNVSFVEPIKFSGTNTSNNAAGSRTNLGLGGTDDVQFKSVKTAGVGSATNLDIQFDGNGSGIFGNTNTNTIGITILSNNVAFFTATNVTFYQAMAFNGTAGASRTNLGLPLTALTNTNNASFQGAVFNTNTNVTNGGSFASLVTWMEVNVVTNGVLTSFRVPLFK